MSLLPAGQRAGQPWEGRARAAPSGDDEPCRESRQRNGGGGIHRDDIGVHRLTSARRTDGSGIAASRVRTCPYRLCAWPKRRPGGGFTGHPVELHCPLCTDMGSSVVHPRVRYPGPAAELEACTRAIPCDEPHRRSRMRAAGDFPRSTTWCWWPPEQASWHPTGWTGCWGGLKAPPGLCRIEGCVPRSMTSRQASCPACARPRSHDGDAGPCSALRSPDHPVTFVGAEVNRTGWSELGPAFGWRAPAGCLDPGSLCAASRGGHSDRLQLGPPGAQAIRVCRK